MKQHPTARELLREIEAFMATTATDTTVFGLAVMNDGNFVPRLRAGRTPRQQTIDKVRAYLKRRSRHAAS